MKKKQKPLYLNRAISMIVMVGYSAFLILMLIMDWYLIREYQYENRRVEQAALNSYIDKTRSYMDRIDRQLYDIYANDENFQALQKKEEPVDEFGHAYELKETLNKRMLAEENMSGFFVFYDNRQKSWYYTNLAKVRAEQTAEIKEILLRHLENDGKMRSWISLTVDGDTNLATYYEKDRVAVFGIHSMKNMEQELRESMGKEISVILLDNGIALENKELSKELELSETVQSYSDSFQMKKGKYQLYGRRIPNMDLWVCTAYPVNLWSVMTVQQLFLLILTGISVFAVGVMYRFVRREVVRPLHQLTDTMNTIRRGGSREVPRMDARFYELSLIHICISGSYTGTADVTFTIRIRRDASFVTEYRIDRLYAVMPREKKLRVGVDAGGLDELGISFIAAPGMDSLGWKREGRYTLYPEDHIARLEGIAGRFSKGSIFAEEPDIPWAQEMKNYILNGIYDVDYRGTADFRSLKENIYTASLYKKSITHAVTAVSDGSCHVRAEVLEPEEYLVSDRDERIKYHGAWYPVEDFSGCRGNTETVSCEKGAFAEFTFCGTGIVWFGSVDTINGIAKVWLDGRLADKCISQKVAGVDFPGSAAGYDKKYGYPLYYVSGLPAGEHTIRIEVSGEKTADSGGCYISIDYFRILTEGRPEPVKLAVLNDFNYPQISWGNYKKPAIRISSGYHNQVEMVLSVRT